MLLHIERMVAFLFCSDHILGNTLLYSSVIKTFAVLLHFKIIYVMVVFSDVGNFFCFEKEFYYDKWSCVLFLQNVDILKDPETVKQLGSILKTNVRACKAVGHPFVIQLGRIYLDMLNVYKCLSENISAAIQANGKQF